MVLFILRNLILQTGMRSHPVGLDVWFFVGPFVYFHSSCVGTSPEPSLIAYVISIIISWAGSNTHHSQIYAYFSEIFNDKSWLGIHTYSLPIEHSTSKCIHFLICTSELHCPISIICHWKQDLHFFIHLHTYFTMQHKYFKFLFKICKRMTGIPNLCSSFNVSHVDHMAP